MDVFFSKSTVMHGIGVQVLGGHISVSRCVDEIFYNILELEGANRLHLKALWYSSKGYPGTQV